jgi:hypothetical protein
MNESIWACFLDDMKVLKAALVWRIPGFLFLLQFCGVIERERLGSHDVERVVGF